MLVIVLAMERVEQGNIWKEKHLEGNKNARRTVYQAKCKKKGKDLETLYSGMIRNVKHLRVVQKGWSKVIRILLVKSA